MKRSLLIILVGLISTLSFGQQRDTIILDLAKTTKIIFTIEDKNDIEILKYYNFQELFQDVLVKLERQDTSALVNKDSTETPMGAENTEDEEAWTRSDPTDEDDHDTDDDTEEWNIHVGNKHWGKTWQSFNFDLGTNNFLSGGKFPDNDNALYTVRPWGSWYFGINSIQRSRIAKKFFLEWGLGLTWYTFKFQNDNVFIQKTDDGVSFIEDARDVNFIKSKLSMSFIQASLIPVIDFGDNNFKPRFWEGYGNSIRMGLGPYVGYKMSSHAKQVYKDDGREKDKNKDNFYINNLRYGIRLQLGYRATDLFFNYDLNELFAEGKGPKLNVFSFGVIF